uniref:uncharacterized protein LOC117608863 isoform X1 n=1 Tax=Osmia lignaria TaxID=473952 RepID=UPI001478FD41|nr:uncharacterized protein LOC117608863 isoform X1 [Osmia lignaria]XP_034190461.1 uncharacterized protein LOC117608863 isoform X2 [Osmia lignaria]XP_034190462.1 uncharacterized protein LOC117608863 isoform X2 [Osmia lignaria]
MASEADRLAYLDYLERVKAGVSVPIRPGAPTALEWRDSDLATICDKLTFPERVRTTASMKSCLIRFYNFYFYGRLPNHSSPHQIIFPILCYLPLDFRMETGINFFFPDNLIGPNSFFALPTGDEATLELEDAEFTPSIYIVEDLPDPTRRDDIARLFVTLETPQIKAFKKEITRLVNKFDPDNYTLDDMKILRLSSYLALLLCRSFAKDSKQMSRAMSKKAVLEHLTKLVAWPVGDGYAPPCKVCIDSSVQGLDKGLKHSQDMMALILHTWIKHMVAKHCPISSVLQAGMLTHLAGNGMGLIILMMGACETLGCTYGALLDNTMTVKTN